MSIQPVTHRAVAATLLAHPMRTRILAAAREPISAAGLARTLGEPRQRVNYHVRQLAAAGLLRAAGRQRKRNMTEQQYVASAAAYVLSPAVLGEAAPATGETSDVSSAAELVAACARAQTDVAQMMEAAQEAGVRVRTTAVASEVRFESVEQRAEFTQALLAAVGDVVARHAVSATGPEGGPASGRPFRLLLACYPVPR